MGITARLCPFTTSSVQRFLISGPDLRIDARFTPETSFCVHRFLISSPDLRIDASFSPITPFCVHRFLISGSNLGINAAEKSSACSGRSGNEVRVRFYSSLPRRRMVPPAAVVATTKNSPPAAPSWGACPRRINALRPNLIFFAAKWNGSACSSRCDNEE